LFVTSRIDFTQPLDADAPRLRHRFGAPRKVLVAHALNEVREVLDAVHNAAQHGRWCVGYVRYEAAAAFDEAFVTHAVDGPLAWFAVYDAPLVERGAAKAASDGGVRADGGANSLGRTTIAGRSTVDDSDGPGGLDGGAQLLWDDDSLNRADFDDAIHAIHGAIEAGELYQVNHTAQLQGRLSGQPSALFTQLQRAQPGGYAAHIDTGDEQVLSVSPELFFDWQDGADGGHILARPMKGTAPRGATPEEDAAHAEHLRTAPKERAENVMIVDLLRNDLSRIAKPHSVQVPVMFATQALPTVWQMTSDVQARTRAGTTLTDIFAALFPCGSITGAPKVRAMQMIARLEPGPRGVYCGAVGVVRPVAGSADKGQVQAGGVGNGLHRVAATFNVPIRTVVLRPLTAERGYSASCGIGSGITSGAQADAEWAEWHHKRAFVKRASMSFDILETMALQDGKFQNSDLHVKRMSDAAAHFGFPCNEHAVRQELQIVALRHLNGGWRVRVLLAADGHARTEAVQLMSTGEPVRLQLAQRAFAAAHSEFVRYKTTQRTHYAAFAPTDKSVFDTVLWNEDGEITESTFGNIAALIDGRWVTPALSCGLLPGIGRAVALRDGHLVEGIVQVSDVPRVQAWAFINSLRGWLAAELVDGGAIDGVSTAAPAGLSGQRA
jgi:para-aminobenzoate synthetase/4-amino-4-deoxychorismate lyase